MAVHDGPNRIGNGVVHIVALDENRTEPGHAALALERPGSVQHLRQLGEDARGIALAGRRLAGAQADLSLRHRNT